MASPPRLDPDKDRALVERCLEGDARAWESLVSRHERLVYAVARSYRLQDEDLEDVFQDVFTALVKGLPQIRDGRALTRWLSRTTDRIALATALRRRREAAQRPATDPQILDAQAADQPLPEAGIETIEVQARLRLALAELPRRCRQLLSALYYEDPQPSYRTLARRFGVAIGSLGPTRARCFEKLRSILASSDARSRRISLSDAPTSRSTGSPPRTRGRRSVLAEARSSTRTDSG